MTNLKMPLFNEDYTKRLGFIGECYVMLELAKRGTYSQKLYDVFDYDLIVNGGIRLEVKTSKIVIHKDKRRNTERKLWSFMNFNKKRRCDFYVFVCLDNNNLPEKFYVIPSFIINVVSNCITIPREYKRKKRFERYENNWGILHEMCN